MKFNRSDDVIIHLLGRLGHARALAEKLKKDRQETRIFLVSDDILEPSPWASMLVRSDEARKRFKEAGISRPGLFVILISNEPEYLRLSKIIKAFMLSLALHPSKRLVYLQAWSGRCTLRQKAAEAALRAIALAFRPVYLAGLWLLHLLGEMVFKVINGKDRKAPFKLRDIRKVLIISLDLTGDLVWAAPAISAVKRTLHTANVDLLVNPRNHGLADLIEGVDRVIEYDAPWFRKIHNGASSRGLWNNLRTRMSLLFSRYDLTVEFRGEARDAVLAYFTGAPHRAAFTGSSTGVIQSGDVSYLLTHKVELDEKGRDGLHMLQRNMAVTGSLGFGGRAPDRWLGVSEETRGNVMEMLEEAGVSWSRPLIGIQPGASRPEKRWDKDKFARVASDLVNQFGATVVIAGSGDEAPLAEYIQEKAPGAVNLAGRTTLAEFIALISICDLFITNDTSAISISSAVGTRVVCLMITVRELMGPVGVKCAVLQKKPECWNPVGEHCFCPYGFRCLQEVTVEEVLEAARDLLSP